MVHSSLIFRRRLPERGSESFRDFSISSFQWSIPLSSFAVVSLSVAVSLLETFPYHPFNGPFLSLIFRRRLPERGSESFRDFSISSFQWSIPLSHLSPSSPWAWQDEREESFRYGKVSKRLFHHHPFQWSMEKSLSSFAVVSLSVAASLLETFPYHPFNGPFLSPLIFRRRLPERGSESFRDFSISSFQWSSPLSDSLPRSLRRRQRWERGIFHWKDDMEKSSKRLAATLRETTAKDEREEWTIERIKRLAATLRETTAWTIERINGPFLSLIFRRRLPERGSESFRDFSISSFQWSIPLSSFAVVSLSVAASLLEAFPYHPFNGLKDSLPSGRRRLSIDLSEKSTLHAQGAWQMSLLEDDMEKSLKDLPQTTAKDERENIILSMVHSSLSSFAVVSLSVAASLLEAFPYHPFNGPFLSHLSPSSPWAWQRVF